MYYFILFYSKWSIFYNFECNNCNIKSNINSIIFNIKKQNPINYDRNPILMIIINYLMEKD